MAMCSTRGARPTKIINAGQCGRYHDRATIDVSEQTGGRVGISIFHATLRALPYTLDLIERHPEGSQAFIPMSADPFLVIVSDGPDATPKAFVTNGAQGINFHRGTMAWRADAACGQRAVCGDRQDRGDPEPRRACLRHPVDHFLSTSASARP